MAQAVSCKGDPAAEEGVPEWQLAEFEERDPSRLKETLLVVPVPKAPVFEMPSDPSQKKQVEYEQSDPRCPPGAPIALIAWAGTRGGAKGGGHGVIQALAHADRHARDLSKHEIARIPGDPVEVDFRRTGQMVKEELHDLTHLEARQMHAEAVA